MQPRNMCMFQETVVPLIKSEKFLHDRDNDMCVHHHTDPPDQEEHVRIARQKLLLLEEMVVLVIKKSIAFLIETVVLFSPKRLLSASLLNNKSFHDELKLLVGNEDL